MENKVRRSEPIIQKNYWHNLEVITIWPEVWGYWEAHAACKMVEEGMPISFYILDWLGLFGETKESRECSVSSLGHLS